jgi:prolipoprotein diacylglyceryltransferase
VQIYEMLAGAAALGAWWVATAPRFQGVAGRPFLIAVAAYAAGRLFVDAFKETTPLMSGGIHLVQVASLAVMLAALLLLYRLSAAKAVNRSAVRSRTTSA